MLEKVMSAIGYCFAILVNYGTDEETAKEMIYKKIVSLKKEINL